MAIAYERGPAPSGCRLRVRRSPFTPSDARTSLKLSRGQESRLGPQSGPTAGGDCRGAWLHGVGGPCRGSGPWRSRELARSPGAVRRNQAQHRRRDPAENMLVKCCRLVARGLLLAALVSDLISTAETFSSLVARHPPTAPGGGGPAVGGPWWQGSDSNRKLARRMVVQRFELKRIAWVLSRTLGSTVLR